MDSTHLLLQDDLEARLVVTEQYASHEDQLCEVSMKVGNRRGGYHSLEVTEM